MAEPDTAATDDDRMAIDDDRFIITTALGVEIQPTARANGLHIDISNPGDAPIILTADEGVALAQFLLQSSRWARGE